MTISLIIPVYNGGHKFQACMQSVAALDPRPHEVIVVADADNDGSRDVAAAYGATVIVQQPQAGPAQARNLGALNASGDVLFFLDADCTAPPDILERVDRVMSDPAVAALIGSYDDTPGDPHFLSQYKNLMHHYTHQMGSADASTFWGACGAVRRDIFMQLGGFDAKKYARPAIEDIELGYRMRAAGNRIILAKEVQIKHLKRWTPRNLFKTDFYDRALPWSELLLTQGEMINDLNLKQGDRLSVALSGTLVGGMGLSLIGALGRRGWWSGVGGLFAVMSAAGLIVLNRSVYQFLTRKRGGGFMLRSIPWHWFYFFYSGVAYAIALIRVKTKVNLL